ncbi:MAG: universal stress protein [Acidobacteria bacterium]|nr:universal stress protein [Acidobacteriota bacterium]
MKVLVAYDGSKYSEAALDDLGRAGLPDVGELVIMSVAEVWLPTRDDVVRAALFSVGSGSDVETGKDVIPVHESDRRIVAEAETLANHARKRLQKLLPDWKIRASATYGSPARAILACADEIMPDLIVLGPHGRSAISRLFLGSISQKVITEADRSVRVARERPDADHEPVRLVIGFDGSPGADAAVEAVAGRDWPEQTEVRLVAATEQVTPTAIGRFIPPVAEAVEDINESERERIEELAGNALETLRELKLAASLHIHSGNPKKVLIEEAERQNADCIFVGATAFGGRAERFLLGSTSAAVAARAHCSVEVVRKVRHPDLN